jgi:hypothetical protein
MPPLENSLPLFRRAPLGDGSGAAALFKIAVISARIHAKKRCFVTEIRGFPGLFVH